MLNPVADEDFQVAIVHPDWYLHPHLPVGGADEVSDLVPNAEAVTGLVEVDSPPETGSSLPDSP